MTSKVAQFPPDSDSPLEDLFNAADSDEDSFSFPDSTMELDSEPVKVDYAGAVLKRMEENKAFAMLYRTGSDGKLLQVVRRREYQPLTSSSMQRIKLAEPKTAGSPLLQENEVQQREEQWHFRYHYWKFVPKSKNYSAASLRRPPVVTGSLPAPPFHLPQVPLDNHPAKAFHPPSRVGRLIPSADKLPQTARDLGLDFNATQLAERFKSFSTRGRMGTGLSTRTTRVSQVNKKQQREIAEVQPSGKLFNPEEFRRERIMAEQAKALFMSGAFSKYYNAERENADREMMGWIKYS